MDFEFLNPLKKSGFKELEIEIGEGTITRFRLVVAPRKVDALIQGELEMRTEIHLTLGSDLITYGLDKFLLIVKELTGRGDRPVTSTLKYSVVRVKPEFTVDERKRLEKLYYKKVNAPVQKFLDALGPRVKKMREFIKDSDQFIREETREVAAKEIVQRLKKATEDFGFDLERISRRTKDLLGLVANMFGEPDAQKLEAQEYQAIIFKKKSKRTAVAKPQLIINQRHDALQIIGGSKIDPHFKDISPDLLYDTLRYYLLIKVPKRK